MRHTPLTPSPSPKKRPKRRERRLNMRRSNDLALAALPTRLSHLEMRVSNFEAGLDENTRLTKSIDESTKNIVAFVKDVDVVWRVCKRIRMGMFRMAKWTAAIGAAVTSVIAAAHAVGAFDVGKWWRGL